MKILADGRSFVQEHTPQLPVFHDKPDPHRPGDSGTHRRADVQRSRCVNHARCGSGIVSMLSAAAR